MTKYSLSRRCFGKAAAALLAAGTPCLAQTEKREKARIAITLDLEMSRHYPKRGMMEWDFQKGNLDEPTKEYAVQAAEIVEQFGARIHFFCVGRVLEQPKIQWLKTITERGHVVGNHTYDHVNVLADSPENTQFRFQRAPWLVKGKTVADIIRENIRLTDIALQERANIETNGFRTPGGFGQGIRDRDDIQQMLLDLGFQWVSSKYPSHQHGEIGRKPDERIFADIVRAQSEAQPLKYASGLVEIPMSPISDVNAFRAARWKLDWFLEATRRSVDWAIENAAVFDFLCHPSCMVVEDPEFKTIKQICQQVSDSKNRAEITTLDKIAETVT